jgi:hypothetical protein
MTITTRANKGSALTHAEVDTNFTDLRDGVSLQIPSDPTKGLKVDSLGTPGFGWHDMHAAMYLADPAAPEAPTFTTFRNGIKQYLFDVDNEAYLQLHLPHDYVLGTDIYIHVHWSHAGTLVTGGSVTFGWELTYAKGHNQAAFAPSITIVEIQNVSTTPYQHMICEAPCSIIGGSANLFNTSVLEVDGLMFGRIYLESNDITVSSGPQPGIFVHFIDIHYQSTGVPTKNRAPSFY